MKTNTYPKILPSVGAGENAATNDAEDKVDAINAPEPPDLAQLVWKYCKNEIQESFLEVQESLADKNLESRKQLRD